MAPSLRGGEEQVHVIFFLFSRCLKLHLFVTAFKAHSYIFIVWESVWESVWMLLTLNYVLYWQLVLMFMCEQFVQNEKVNLISCTEEENVPDTYPWIFLFMFILLCFLDPCESSLWLWSIWWPLCPLQRVRPILSKGRYTPCNQPGRSKLVAGLSRWRWRKSAFGRPYSRYFIMECLYIYKKVLVVLFKILCEPVKSCRGLGHEPFSTGL